MAKKMDRPALLKTLQARFEANPQRHKGVTWQSVQKKIEGNDRVLDALLAMESTGGEPDVVSFAAAGGKIVFCDCSAESPAGRRSLCYDRQALDARKEAKPAGSAVDHAEKMGAELLTEEQYRELQTFGEFDLKTSSWVRTPEKIRKLGGSLFCDRRYDAVFTYHNGAQSYYAARGFRTLLRV